MNCPVAVLLVADLLHIDSKSIPFKKRPTTFLVAISAQGLSEGREIRFDGKNRSKFCRRRLTGRSVVSLYHAKEAEEFPVFFFFNRKRRKKIQLSINLEI